ncbi:DUF2867 domain-containing protein [Lysobacter sp. HA35]
MLALPDLIATFPSVRLPAHDGGLPIEVALITQLGIGAGDALIEDARKRQSAHPDFVDELDEPSARIGAMDLSRGDPSTLYSFAVGEAGHPFHRHAGHRVFTAISGSAGALLRFSTVADDTMCNDPDAFVRALRQVRIPPDCLFTVRFGGGTWHQFLPANDRASSPALFALSCHTNELGGDLSSDVRAQVAANMADIPSLTDVLPAEVQAVVRRHPIASLPTVSLALHARPGSLALRACAHIRGAVGPVRRTLTRLRPLRGYRAEPARTVEHLASPPAALRLDDGLTHVHHEDIVATTLGAAEVDGRGAPALMADLLRAFVEHSPDAVSALMSMRNVMVAPFRLRTSRLGCPVSSLLGDAPNSFAGFPVLAHARIAGDGVAVLLGADDRHLRFRTTVSIIKGADGQARLSMLTRVHCSNMFGRAYMAAIEAAHRRYIAPTMLRTATDAIARR